MAQVTFYSGNILVLILHFCSGSKTFDIAHRNGAVISSLGGETCLAARTARQSIQQMSSVRNDGNGVARINHWSEPQPGQVQLIAERTDGCVQRHLVVVTRPVEVELGLAVSPRVINNAQAWRPVVSKRELLRLSRHPVLFPAQAEAKAQMLVNCPVVIDEGRQ